MDGPGTQGAPRGMNISEDANQLTDSASKTYANMGIQIALQ
jgi:hypothetical protein